MGWYRGDRGLRNPERGVDKGLEGMDLLKMGGRFLKGLNFIRVLKVSEQT